MPPDQNLGQKGSVSPPSATEIRERADVIVILKASPATDDKIMLDDGEYFIQHNENYPLENGNGFLMKRRALGEADAIGGYEFKIDGKWHVDVTTAWDEETDSDCRMVGVFDERLDAIPALWLARHTAGNC